MPLYPGNSLERIESFIQCEQEPKPTEAGKPPAYWPSTGSLVIEKLKARYSVDGPEVLHDITLDIKSGERIGVVGRTGSGKSSLTLSLLRLIPTKGAVMYDGIITEGINLNALRTNMTISMLISGFFHFSLSFNRITQFVPCFQYHSNRSFSVARHERTWTHSENMTTRRSTMP